MSQIPALSKVSFLPQGVEAQPLQKDTKTEGKNVFETLLKSTNNDQQTSDQAIKDLIEGKTDSVQEVVMAVAKAELSFQLFMEIRNNLIDSYNELMRMQF